LTNTIYDFTIEQKANIGDGSVRKVNILGVSHRKHELNNFYMLREKGQQAFNFVHFTRPVVIVLDGVEHLTDNNACILYSPGHRQEYKSHNGLLINDYITFQIDELDFPARFNLPENEIFYVHKGDEITNRLEWISWAVADKTEPHGADIDDAVMELFAILPKLRIDNHPSLKRMFETKQRFVALRNEMRKAPQNWSVEQMAKQVWLTRSRFSVLYQEFFNISPNADLMNMKTELAKTLLKTTDEPISNISQMCGYASVEYFIRMFNERVKKTPLQYRKAHKNGG